MTDEQLGNTAPTFDTGVPHPARVYNAILGGKDNYAADRAAAEATIRAFPGNAMAALANRAFLARSVRYLAAEAGIRQFLDIGTGLPSADNTHEVAQAAAPGCRVVYVDNDPIVLAHARALLTSAEPGATRVYRGRPARPGEDPPAGLAPDRFHPAGGSHARRRPSPDLR